MNRTFPHIQIKPFKASDADAFYGGTMEQLFCAQQFKTSEESGPCFTMWHGDKVLGCAGVRIFWDGVGEAWAELSPEVVNYRRELLHYVKTYLKQIIDNYKLCRVEATVREDFPMGMRFARHIGFKVDGKRRKYGTDGTDCFLYSIVKEDEPC